MARKVNRLTFILQIVLFVAFLFFGIGKLIISPENASDVFGQIGGTSSQYFTGFYQIISAVLVIIPSLAFIGALMIAVSMATAIILHLVVLGFAGPFIFLFLAAIVLLIIAIYVMIKTKKNLFGKK